MKSEESKGKKAKSQKLTANSQEHKVPWQEAYASVDDIKAMLDSRVLLRYNEVRGRTEVHWLSQGLVIGEDEQGLLTIFGGEGGVTDGYQNLTDRDVNTLWREMSQEKPVVKQHLQNVIESDYVPVYNPFRYYLEHLTPWTSEQGNNIQFLSDTTGTRRWLPFEVESIESPLTTPFDYDGIYAQAYALYQQGFRYWFDRSEIERLMRHNEKYESPCTERELVFWNFRKPAAGELGEFMPVGLAMQIVSGQISSKITKEQMGHAFIDLGFERKTFRNVRGYIVVRRSSDEIERLRRELATGNTHTPDTAFF